MSLKIKISILAICFALVAAVCVGFAFAAPNEKLNLKGTLSYEVPRPVVMVSPNDPALGSTTGSGDYSIGDTVELTATPSSSSNKFLAWATSTDPNEMEIVSTSPTYSFEIAHDSPTTYFALFNSTEIEHTVGDLTYILYNEAKLAKVAAPTSTELSSVEIPAFVQNDSFNQSFRVYSIGEGAFNLCASLTEIIIPEGVAKIGAAAFLNCASLSSVTLPKSLISFDNSLGSPFLASFVKTFKGEGNDYYSIDDGRAIITDGGKTLLAYAAGNEETSYQIPNGVTEIGMGAFYGCSSLTEITIPESVTSIGPSAFQACEGLTEIEIPEGVKSIGSGAFRDCTGLISVSLPSILTEISSNVFNNCSSLTSITIPEGVTSIGSSAFYNCSKLTSITIPESVTSIGESAFGNCHGLTSITIPEGVTAIGANAFNGCRSLTSATLPSTLTSIGYHAFGACLSLTKITIPEGVTEIGSNAFSGCDLEEITINGNIASLGTDAFSYCSKLTSLTLGEGVTTLPSRLFTNNNLTKLTEIEVLGNLISSTFPSGTWYKGESQTPVTSFSGPGTYSTTKPLLAVTVEANETSLGSVSGGGSYDIGETVTLTATPSGSNKFLAWATSLDPNEMEIVSTSATYSFELSLDSPRTYYALFYQTTSTSQTVGNLKYTFYNEAKLASVTGTISDDLSGALEIPSVVQSGENSYKIFSIGEEAFYFCENLTSISIPEGVVEIGDYTFWGCYSLTSIRIPESVTSISEGAFQACYRLTSITLPSTLTSIGNSAFYGCSSLTSITIPEGVTEIDYGAFEGCDNLAAFYGDGNNYYEIVDNGRALLVDGGKTLLAYAPANTATSYVIPGSVTSIGGWAFLNCTNLISITIHNGVTSIGENAFEGCYRLASITIPESVTSIGDEAFRWCDGLSEITINENITSFGTDVFYGCINLTSLTLGAGVTELPDNLLDAYDLSYLTEIVVEEGSTLNAKLPTYGTWYKDGVKVTSFDGEGIYTRTDV